MARTRQNLTTSTGNRITPSRYASTRARELIATHYASRRPRNLPATPYRINPFRSRAAAAATTPPLEREICLCLTKVRRSHARTACWHCNRWHHMRSVVPYGTGADHVDSCIYVWLWPREAEHERGEDPYRPCNLCRDLTCHDPAQIPAIRRCPWCARHFRPTREQAWRRWDDIFASETFQAYAGRLLMGEKAGDRNLRGRMAEFDPQRFVRCDRDLLVGPDAEVVPKGGHRLEEKEWQEWWFGVRRKFQTIRDVIIFEKKRRGMPPVWAVSRINLLAHSLERDEDWDNFRDMFDDRSRMIE